MKSLIDMVNNRHILGNINIINADDGGFRMLKAVIFDMDGVIIDSEPLHFETDTRIMRDLGIEITSEDLNRYVGLTNRAMWIDLKERYGLKESIDELIKIQSAYKNEAVKRFDKGPIPGVRELLAELKSDNIKTAIASSSPVDFIDIVVDKLEIGNYFDAIVSGEEVKHGKPAPDIFLKAAEALGVEPDECVVIEDSTHGVAAASAARMKCIGFRNLNSGINDLSRANMVVDSLLQVNLGIIKGLF